MSKLNYRPEIDGLRAIAVLAVLIFHAGLGLPGGYVGVDVFFVISGFLITSLIVKDLQAGTFSFPHFWERRIRRILPAQAVMVVSVLIVGTIFLFPTDFEALGRSAIAQAAMVANFHFMKKDGYFDGPADLKPLLHTWSLSVEEQFYLFLPLLLVFWKRYFRHGRTWMLATLALASFSLSVWGASAFPTENYFLLPTRAWEMLLGSLLAVRLPAVTLSDRLRSTIGWLGLTGIVAACFWYDKNTRFPGATALLPCAGTVAVLFANAPNLTSSGRILALRPLVIIGQLSYSLYLWHWPILTLMRISYGVELPLEFRLIALTLSFGCAWLSWKFVETPFRRSISLSRRKTYGLAIACNLLIAGVSIGIVAADGAAVRFSKEARLAIQSGDLAKVGHQDELIAIGRELPADQTGKFLLWGDSHARAASELIDRLARTQGLSGYCLYRDGTIPVPGIWAKLDRHESARKRKQETLQFIKTHQIRHVILVSRWSSYVTPINMLMDESTAASTPESACGVLKRGLERMLTELDEAAVTVWIMRQVPEQDVPRPSELLAKKLQYGWPKEIQGVSLQKHRACQRQVDAIFDELARKRDNVHILDPTPYCFDEAGFSLMCDAKRSYYRDDDHLSRHGADILLTPVIQPVMQQISKDTGLANESPQTAPFHIQRVSAEENAEENIVR